MEKTSYLIYGGGKHSRVVISVLEKNGIEVVGLFDADNNTKSTNKIPFLGNYNSQIFPKFKLVIAIGDNSIREKVSQKIKHPIGKIIDFDSRISKDVSIGEGSQIITSSTVNVGTTIGKHCIINTNCSIDLDCKVSEFVHIAPGATICGGVSIGKSTLVGAGATILPNIMIGKNVIIGAGALVNKNISDDAKVFGVPAKIIDDGKE